MVGFARAIKLAERSAEGLGTVVGWGQGHLRSAIFLSLLEADVVFDQKLYELLLVVLRDLSELHSAIGFPLLHSNVQL